MGAASSVASFDMLQRESSKPFDARDVNTPRGQSAVEEVRRLRSILLEQKIMQCMLMAHKQFKKLDKDHSGYLEGPELDKVVELVLSYGTYPDQDKTETKSKIMARVDKNKDGRLDEDEFCELFAEEMRHLAVIRAAREKFKELDDNNSGFLEPAQISKVVDWIVMMEHIPQDHVQASKKKLMDRINAVDHDHNNKLDIDEFTELYEEEQFKIDCARKAYDKFMELDEDRSGFLEAAELNVVVDWMLGLEKTPDKNKEKVKEAMMKRVDSNKDGKLDLDEFTALYEEEMHIVEILKKAEQKFNELDSDNSGYLEKAEFGKVVDFMLRTDLGSKDAKAMTREKCMEMIHAKDTDKDGQLSLDEFTLLYEEVLGAIPRDSEAIPPLEGEGAQDTEAVEGGGVAE